MSSTLLVLWILGFFFCAIFGWIFYITAQVDSRSKEEYLKYRKQAARVVLLSPIWFIWILVGVVWILVKLLKGLYTMFLAAIGKEAS